MSYNFNGLGDDDFVTVSFRCPVRQARLVNDAAALKKMSVADYVRSIILEWAAADLGVTVPQSPLELTKLIDQAAATAGLSRKDFLMQAAAEKLAASMTTELKERAKSGEYLRVAPSHGQMANAREALRRRGVAR